MHQKLKKTALAAASVILGYGFSALAENNSSDAIEYFYQPAAGQHAVQPGIDYFDFLYRQKGAPDYKQSGMRQLGVSYAYGLNSEMSLGANLSYESSKITYNGLSNSASGLNDPKLYFKGNHGLPFGLLHYGLDVNVGIMKGEFDTTTGLQKAAATGALSFAPYAGVSMKAGPGVLGGRLQYDIRGDRTYKLSGVGDTKHKHGNILTIAGFYEQTFVDMLFGGEVAYDSTEKVTVVGPTGILTDVSAESTLSLAAYGRLPVANFQLIPKVKYSMKASGEDLEKYSLVAISVDGRWTF